MLDFSRLNGRSVNAYWYWIASLFSQHQGKRYVNIIHQWKACVCLGAWYNQWDTHRCQPEDVWMPRICWAKGCPLHFIAQEPTLGLWFLLPSILSLPSQRCFTPKLVGKHNLLSLFLHHSFSCGKWDSAQGCCWGKQKQEISDCFPLEMWASAYCGDPSVLLSTGCSHSESVAMQCCSSSALSPQQRKTSGVSVGARGLD